MSDKQFFGEVDVNQEDMQHDIEENLIHGDNATTSPTETVATSDEDVNIPLLSEKIITEESAKPPIPEKIITEESVKPPIPEKIVINEQPSDKNEKAKSNRFVHKIVAASLITAVGFGSLGVGIGAGGALAHQLSNRLFSESSNNNVHFDSNSVEATQEAVQITLYNHTEMPRADFATSMAVSNNKTVPEVVAAVKDAVVSITVSVPNTQSFFGRHFSFDRSGAGSGIIFAEDEENIFILTNNHVIDSATGVTISIDDTIETNATYVGSDASHDIAVISVRKSDLHENGITDITIARFGDSDALLVGESVVAIGNALGEGKSATLGIISAKDRVVTVAGNRMVFLQTDAAINSGNSGGPLVDGNATVVGINTAKFSSYSIEGMGLSIPINQVRDIIYDILENGNAQRPGIGIMGQAVTEEMKHVHDFPDGVIIREVVPGGAAYLAGILQYDIIVEFNGVAITTMQDLTGTIANTNVGDTVMLTVNRSNGLTSVDRILQLTIQDLNAGTF